MNFPIIDLHDLEHEDPVYREKRIQQVTKDIGKASVEFGFFIV